MSKTNFQYPRFENLQDSEVRLKSVYEHGDSETHLFEDQNLFGETALTQRDKLAAYGKVQTQIRQTVRFYPDRDRSSDRYVYAVDDPNHWANYRTYRYGDELRRRLPHSLTAEYVRNYGNLEWYTPRYMAHDRITYQDTLIDQPQALLDRIARPESGLFYPVSDQFLSAYKEELLTKRFPYRFDWPRTFDEYGEEPDYPFIGTQFVLDPNLLERLPAFDNFNYFDDQEFTHTRYLWNWLERATYNDPVAMRPPSTRADALTFPSLSETPRSMLNVAQSKVQNIRRIVNLQLNPEQRYHTLDYNRPLDLWSEHRDQDPSIEQLCYEPGTAEYLVIHPEWANTPIAVFGDGDCTPAPGFPDGNRPQRWNLTVIRLDRSVEHSTVFADSQGAAIDQIVGEYYAVVATPVNVVGEHYHDTADRIDQLLRFYTNRVEFARMLGTPDMAKQYDTTLTGLEHIDGLEPRVLDANTFELDRWESILVGVSPYEQPRIDGDASYPWGATLDANPLEDRQFEFDTFSHFQMDVPAKTRDPDPVDTQIQFYHMVLPFSIQHEFFDSEVEMDSGRLLDTSAYSFHSWNNLQHPYVPGEHYSPPKHSLKQWFQAARPEQILEPHPNVIFNGNVSIESDNTRRSIIEVVQCDDTEAVCDLNSSLKPPQFEYNPGPSFAALNPFDDDHYGVRNYFDWVDVDYVDQTFGNGMDHIYRDSLPLDLNQATIPQPTFDPNTLTWATDSLLEFQEKEQRLDGDEIPFSAPEILEPYQEQSTFLIAPAWIEIRRSKQPIIGVNVDPPIIAIDSDGAEIEVSVDSAILEVEHIPE